GGVEQMVDAPRHPYTRGLLASTVHSGMRGQRLEAIPGAPPDLAEVPAACSFAPRCKHAEARCLSSPPPLIAATEGHLVRCVGRVDRAISGHLAGNARTHMADRTGHIPPG